MKRRIYLIALLAMVNLVIMKYHEFKSERKGNTWAMAGNEQVGNTDSIGTNSSR